MEIILTLEAAQQIRSVLGDDIDLSPGAVPSALSRLAVEAPAVYSQILANLSGTQIRFSRLSLRKSLIFQALAKATE